MTSGERAVDTLAGPMRIFLTAPDDGEEAPVVVVLMDAPGYREALKDVARRLAEEGYRAALPDLYHREGPVAFDEERLVAGDQEEFGRLVATMNRLSDEMTLEDLRATLDALGAAGPVGVIGFCMGGRFAIRAMAAGDDRLRAAAVIHPSFIVTDASDSPHLSLGPDGGAYYFAFGGADQLTDPETVPPVVREQLEATDATYEIDVLPGGDHGFMVAGARHDPEAAEGAWQGTLRLFASTLR
jgi:carboxymethylenebutenolidase